MEKIRLIGSATQGIMVSKYAELVLTEEVLRVEGFFSNYVFTLADIESIEVRNSFLSMGNQIKIYHTHKNYKKNVIFTGKIGEDVVAKIKETPFGVKISTDEPSSKPKEVYRFPIQKRYTLGFVIFLYMLLIVDVVRFLYDRQRIPFGVGTMAALGSTFLVCTLLSISEKFRSLVLKEGATIYPYNILVYLLMFFTGSLFCIVLLLCSISLLNS